MGEHVEKALFRALSERSQEKAYNFEARQTPRRDDHPTTETHMARHTGASRLGSGPSSLASVPAGHAEIRPRQTTWEDGPLHRPYDRPYAVVS